MSFVSPPYLILFLLLSSSYLILILLLSSSYLILILLLSNSYLPLIWLLSEARKKTPHRETFKTRIVVNYPLISVAYRCPAEIAESAERISVQVSAISALSAGLDAALLLVVLQPFDEEEQFDGLEHQVDDIQYAESYGEDLGCRQVGEHVDAQHHEVQEHAAHGEPQEVLDKDTGVFGHTFDDGPMLKSGDDGEVEHRQRHGHKEIARAAPQQQERCQHQQDGNDQQFDVVLFHRTSRRI